MTTAPKNLDELRDITDPAERAQAVARYLARLEEKRGEAVVVRRGAIAELLEANDRHDWKRPAVIAGRIGVSVSTVKAVRAELDG